MPSPVDEITLRTRILPTGDARITRVVGGGDALSIVEETDAGPVHFPLAANLVVGAFARYGRPLEAPLPPRAPDDAAILFIAPDGRLATLRAFAYRAPVDVIENDYLLLELAGEEPVAVAAPLIGPALIALARAAAAAR